MLPKIIDFKSLSNQEIQDFIFEVERIAKTCEQVEIPLHHYFSKSVYAREIFIPKGSLIVGEIHRHENLNILSQGECSVLSIDGCIKIKAPHTLVASPGTKRVIFAHEDSTWTTIHGTDERDLEKIEQEFIVKVEGDKWLG